MPSSRSAAPARIAMLGDDNRAVERLASLLKASGYEVSVARTPRDLALDPPSMAVFQDTAVEPLAALCAQLRADPTGQSLPVLCLCPNAKPAAIARVLDAGADDCLGRPFSDEVFQARVRALLRRRLWSQGSSETRIEAGPLELSLLERTASMDGKTLPLTRLEFELLAYLAARPGRAVTRAELLQAVWNYPADVETRTLDKHVESLRKKLEPKDGLVETVRAVGYRLKV